MSDNKDLPKLPYVGQQFTDSDGQLWEVWGTGGSATHREVGLRLKPPAAQAKTT